MQYEYRPARRNGNRKCRQNIHGDCTGIQYLVRHVITPVKRTTRNKLSRIWITLVMMTSMTYNNTIIAPPRCWQIQFKISFSQGDNFLMSGSLMPKLIYCSTAWCSPAKLHLRLLDSMVSVNAVILGCASGVIWVSLAESLPPAPCISIVSKYIIHDVSVARKNSSYSLH